MIDCEGNPQLVDRGQLIAALDRAKAEHDLDDAQLCAALNRNPRRYAGKRNSGPDHPRIDARLLRNLREGGALNDARLSHIAEALQREFKFALPSQGAVTRTFSKKLHDKASQLPMGKLAGIGASLAVLAIYLGSDAAYRDRFEGLATIVGILPIILACFILFDHFKSKS